MTAATTTSQKRIEANRRNDARSTGPWAAEDKSRVRLDAPRHGLTAATAVLPGEDPEALQSRVEAWQRYLRPRGDLEHYLVERAAQVAWQLDRADRTIAARLTDRMLHHESDRRGAGLDGLAFDDSDEGERLRRYQLASGRTLLRTLDTLFRVRKEAAARDGVPDEPEVASPTPANDARPDSFWEVNWPRVLAAAGISPAGSSESAPEDRPEPAAQPGELSGESAAIRDDETNPTQARGPEPIPLDPCSEGRHAEPKIVEGPPSLLPDGRRKTGRSESGRREASGPIPPLILHLLGEPAHSRGEIRPAAPVVRRPVLAVDPP